ncbi:MAG: hypothetical protein Q8L48_07325 [Archangium sp.]|nr:hypothetical protein [Archangium sp.]
MGGGEGGNGGHVGVRVEQRDFADEPLAEFNGDLAEVREDLNRLQDQITRRALDATALRFLTPILG